MPSMCGAISRGHPESSGANFLRIRIQTMRPGPITQAEEGLASRGGGRLGNTTQRNATALALDQGVFALRRSFLTIYDPLPVIVLQDIYYTSIIPALLAILRCCEDNNPLNTYLKLTSLYLYMAISRKYFNALLPPASCLLFFIEFFVVQPGFHMPTRIRIYAHAQ